MCGIAGIWRPGGASHDDLRRMVSAMRHRGPEGASFAALDGGDLRLGFLMLGFTDTATGQQPLFDGDLAIVYNGEIYDYEALRDDLVARGHRFRTRSDTEVVLHLYREHGERFTEHLNGEFALAIWDGRTRELLLVRDRFGVKPLYWARHRGALVFASECKAILALDGFVPEMDVDWFSGPGLGLPDTSRSPFVGLRPVRPGHLLRVDLRGERPSRWWNPRFEKAGLSLPEAAEAVRAELGKAVARRIGGDVPIALALSSGIDSAIVAGLTAQIRPDRRTFCLSYPGKVYDEAERAQRTAAHYGLAFEPVPVTAQSLADGFLASIRSTEIATNSLSTAARLHLAAAVRRAGFKALAGGEASDEIFGGYPYFGAEAIWRSADTAAWDRFRAEEAVSRGVFWDDGRPPPSPYPPSYQGRVDRSARWLPRLLSRQARDRLGANPNDALVREFGDVVPGLEPFDALRLVSRGIFSTFAVVGLGDRVEMASSLEGRVPFLDAHLVALAYSLPEPYCVEPGTFERKHVLRVAFAGFLPPRFDPLPKHTWMAPRFDDLYRTPTGRELFETFLSDAAVRRVGLLNPLTVRALRAAWRAWPRRDRRFDAIDSFVGYFLSVQAMHHAFVEKPSAFAHPGLLPLDDDRTPQVHQAAS